MKKLAALLFFIFLAGLAFPPPPAHAQAGFCPSGVSPDGGVWVTYLVDTPAGTFPANSLICVSNSVNQYTIDNDSYPCGQQVYSVSNLFGVAPINYPIYLIPPVDHPVASPLRLEFIWHRAWSISSTVAPYMDKIGFDIRYVNQFGQVEYQEVNWLATSDSLTLVMMQSGLYRAEAVIADLLIPIATDNGYIRIEVMFDVENDWDYPIVYGGYHWTSIHLGRADLVFPAHCPLPGAPLPPTATPQATATPNPTGTPTSTPPAAIPTSPPATIMPPPTRTPVTFQQMPAEPTATPWAIPTMANLIFPTPAGITPAAPLILEQQGTIVSGWNDELNYIEGAWATPAARAWGFIDMWSPDYQPPAPITGTEVISTPVQTITDGMANITLPIQLMKSVRIYAPNLWPLVYFAFLIVGIMIAVSFTKFAVAIVTTIIEIVRRLWQALPLT